MPLGVNSASRSYVAKTLGSAAKQYSNLVRLGIVGVAAIGMIFTYAARPPSPGHASVGDVAFVLLAQELGTGSTLGSGTGGQVLAGVTTDSSIWTASGAIILGDLANPNCIINNDGTLTGCSFGGTNTGALANTFDKRYVQVAGSTMSGGLMIVNGGSTPLPTIEAGLLLEIAGAASGLVLHAQDVLGSSGTLLVEGGAILESTLTINGVTYTFPYGDGSASGKVLATNSAGQLSWVTDATGAGAVNSFGTGNVITIGDSRYVNLSGDTMTGGLILQGANLTASGIYATGSLSASGTLSVEGESYFGNDVHGIALNELENMTANKTFSNDANSVSFNFTNTTNQPTYDGAFEIQASGAFTGDLFHVHQHTGNPGATDLVHLHSEDSDVLPLRITGVNPYALRASGSILVWDDLEAKGTLSGASLNVGGNSTLSGTLSVDGISYLNSASVFGSTLQLNGVTYTFPYGDGAASGKVLKTNSAGQLSWATDTDTDTNTTYSAGKGLTLSNNFFSLNDILTGSTLRITGDASASGSLSVDGLVFLNSNTTITGNLNTSGNISGSGVLSVDGLAYLNGGVTTTNLNATNLSASGVLSVDGQASFTLPLRASGAVISPSKDFIIMLSNPQTRATSGSSVFQFYAPFDGQFNSAFLSHDDNGSGVTIDVNVNSRSIFSTLLTTDEQEKTSTGATTPSVLGNTTFVRNQLVSVDMDACGTGAGARCPEGVVLQLTATGSVFP